MLGVVLFPWQRWLLIHAMELRPDGRFRFRIVLVLVARQNGKTTTIEVKNLWKMYVLASKILGTAQDLDLSEESWTNAVEMAEGIEELAVEIKHVDKTNGKKALRLNNGARWKVKAANRRGGRGFSGDDVNLDELREHLNWFAWGAVTKTTLARRDPQIWAVTNAGDDTSVVLNDLQAKGRAAAEAVSVEDMSLGHFEWSAPDEVRCTCDRVPPALHAADCRLADRELWAMANPSMGHGGVTEEALLSALNTDPNEVYLTECLCVRVPTLVPTAIDMERWAELLDPRSARAGDVGLGVDIAPARDYAALAMYGPNTDGLGHLQVVDARPGTDWLIPRLLELRSSLNPVAIGMGRGTFLSLETDLKNAGVTVPKEKDKPQRGDLLMLTGGDMAAACANIIDAVKQRTLRVKPHPEHPEILDTAVAGARTRQGVDSIGWSRADADTDITPLVAGTAARWAYVSRVDSLAPPPAPAAVNSAPTGDTRNLWRPTQRLGI